MTGDLKLSSTGVRCISAKDTAVLHTQRAAYGHSDTADSALLHLLTSLQSSTETAQEHTGLLVSASLRLTSRDKQSHVGALCPSPHDVWRHALPCQSDAKPCRAMSSTSWGLPADSPQLIVRCLKCFSFLSQSDTNQRPLRLVPSRCV